MAYVREDGNVGIRNDIWIVNTVGCVNKTAQILAEKTGAKIAITEGSYKNIKITTPEDIEIAELFLEGEKWT